MFTVTPQIGRQKPHYVATGPDAVKALFIFEGVSGVTYRGRTLTLPAEPRIYEMLTERLSLEPDQKAADWYAFSTQEERRVAQALLRPPSIEHAHASKLRPYQAVGAAYLNETGQCLLCDDVGTGKLLPNSEPVLTPTGWVENGSLRAGDLVIDEHGFPVEVLKVFPQGVQKIVRITFSDGSWVRCSRDHLWAAKTGNDAHREGDWRILTTQEILDDGLKYKTGQRKWRIPLVEAVQFNSSPLPLDPYVLGVLLGDGSFEKYSVTLTTDKEIVDRSGLKGTHTFNKSAGITDFRVSDRKVFSIIKDLGLWGKRSWEKVIPQKYLYACIEDRLALLQGLMDTDGYAMPKGGAEFCSTSASLLDGVVELTQSLGGIARGRRVAASTYTYKGEKRKGRRAERVNIKLPAHLNPFRLSRKHDAHIAPSKYPSVRLIGRIDEDGTEESTCILVDSASHLYVTRSYIVTHNTAQAIVGIDISKSNSKILVVGPNSVKYQWRSEIATWSTSDLPVCIVTPKTAQEDIRSYKSGWLIMNYHNMRAHKALLLPTLFDWIVFDEAHALVNRKTQAFDVAKHLKHKRMVLLTGTPIGNSPEDLWALLNLVDPESFPSYWRFFELYVRYSQNNFGARAILGTKNETYLRRELAPRMIRRMKEDVAADLPEKQHVLVPIEMTEKQAKFYRELVESLSTKDEEGHEISVLSAISLVLRLRQMISTPFAFGMEDTSGKLDALEEIVTGTDEKVVVFSLFLKTVDCICARLTKLGVPWARITGKESAEERDVSQQKLNAGEVRVLVCTTGAGGAGLNLQAASVGIFVEKHWNPRDQYQAENRIHRIGTTRNVTVYTLHAIESIDDAVARVLARKQAMSDAILAEALAEELERYRVVDRIQ